MKLFKTLSVLGALALSTNALAVDNNTVLVGGYFINFDVTTPGLQGPGTVPGLGADVKSITTAYLAYTRRLTEHFSVELAAGDPPTAKTVGVGPSKLGSVPYDGQTLITARWLSPTVLVEYTFLDEKSPIRPYIGLGINHTVFYNRVVTDAGAQVTGGPTSVSLSPSTGGAATVGLAYNIAPHWVAHASLSVSNIHTSAVADTAGVERTANISFGPKAAVIAVGYTF
jgi:outer membrane protein